MSQKNIKHAADDNIQQSRRWYLT